MLYASSDLASWVPMKAAATKAWRTWSLDSKLADISQLAKRSAEEATDKGCTAHGVYRPGWLNMETSACRAPWPLHHTHSFCACLLPTDTSQHFSSRCTVMGSDAETDWMLVCRAVEEMQATEECNGVILKSKCR